ncbi:MAG: sugar kinase [Chthoniobacteraceae bacterium]
MPPFPSPETTVVTLGELMLRLSPPGHQRFAQASQFDLHIGGAEANVAVGLAHWGVGSRFVTRLPAHELGDRCVAELRRHGVNTNAVARGGDRLGLYFLEHGASQRASQIIYDRACSAFATASPVEFDWETILNGAEWFHWSGITPALSDQARRIATDACAAAHQLGLTVSFDMNYRARLWSAEEAAKTLRPMMANVDLCICGLDEAQSVLGIPPGDEEPTGVALREQFGFRSVLIPKRVSQSASHTSWKATLLNGEGVFHSPVYEIDIIDRVGAGDSLTAGLIFSQRRGDDSQTSVNFAVAASALKHTIPGDFNLVSVAEVEALAAGGHGGRVKR